MSGGSTFGLGEWGLDIWGAAAELTLESAVAATTHSVLVTLSAPPLAESPIGTGDALNPGTWEVARDDRSYIWTVTASERITDRRFLLYLRTALQSANRVHTVGSTTLLSTARLLITAPYTIDFRGVLPATDVTEPLGPFDFESTNINAGGLRTTEAGSYARIYGDDVVRKMVLRRITTMPGSYFHIAPPEFGQDLKSKERIRASALPTLKLRIDNEIMKEPGVVAASSALSLEEGVLKIHAKVQTNEKTFEIGVSAQ